MAFTTLEERFNQVSKQIYSRFSPSEDQLVKILPNTNGVLGSKSRVKNDTRLLPLVSTARDITRISLFLKSTDGLLFIGKQTLLQTGNTFAETRLYDPFEALINTDPFLGRGTVRHVGFPIALNNLKTPTRTNRGALQTETIDSFSSPETNSKLVSRLLAQANAAKTSVLNANKYAPQKTTYFGDPTKEFYVRPEDSNFYPERINLIWSRVGNFSSYIDSSVYAQFGAKLFEVQPLSSRGTVKTKQSTTKSTWVDRYITFGTQKPGGTNTRGKKTFKELESTLSTNGYFVGPQLNVQDLTPEVDNVEIIKNGLRDSSGVTVKYPNILDPYNGVYARAQQVEAVRRNENETDVSQEVTTPFSVLYRNITGDPKAESIVYGASDKSDIIKFIFTTNQPQAEPVHFRAFISTFKQNVKPEYNEQRYVGRTERFVTYAGVKRTANLEFDIAAFGQSELNQVWARVNYLTGLAFPTGFSLSGFMVPPLFKLTIGGIYENQPCYIDSLDFDFINDTTTFDIDSEVTQVIHVNMSIVLLEKKSKTFDSPFYKIMEDLEASTTTR